MGGVQANVCRRFDPVQYDGNSSPVVPCRHGGEVEVVAVLLPAGEEPGVQLVAVVDDEQVRVRGQVGEVVLLGADVAELGRVLLVMHPHPERLVLRVRRAADDQLVPGGPGLGPAPT